MVTTIARSIAVEEAQAVVAEIERTETLAPFIDPTWYRGAMTHVHNHKREGRAFLIFRQEVEAVLDEEVAAKQRRGD